MKKAWIVLIALVLAGCGGTEVLNPQETITAKSSGGTFTIGLPEGWTYSLCVDDPAPCNEAYEDPAGTSEPLLIMSKGGTKNVFFANELADGEGLTQFVDARTNSQDEVEYLAEDGIETAFVNVVEDEFYNEYFMLFATDGTLVAWLWVKIDLEGLNEAEANALVQEWLVAGQSITISE